MKSGDEFEAVIHHFNYQTKDYRTILKGGTQCLDK